MNTTSVDELLRFHERQDGAVDESPNGSEGVSGTGAHLSHGAGRYRAIDWFSVGTWTGVSQSIGLKKCEEIMIACFKIGGGLAEYKYPPPTWKKIEPFVRKSVGFSQFLDLCVRIWYSLTI